MRKEMDLFLFMGQSNMAGRGIFSSRWPEKAPQIAEGAGYEFRAISSPDRFYPMEEPFGVNENNPEGIFEKYPKTGSMVTAFTNAYFEKTGIPVLGVSASMGGSRIREWNPKGPLFRDALKRMKDALRFTEQSSWKIRHRYVLWCQGEGDGSDGMSAVDYQQEFETLLKGFLANGIEICFMVQIGNYNGTDKQDYGEIRRAQEIIASRIPQVVMVSRDFAGMKDRGLMKDDLHYYQAAYNETGTHAGTCAAYYVNTGEKPEV